MTKTRCTVQLQSSKKLLTLHRKHLDEITHKTLMLCVTEQLPHDITIVEETSELGLGPDL